VPILTGNNRDEGGATPQPDVKPAEFLTAAKRQYGPMADAFLNLYPASSDAEAGQAKEGAHHGSGSAMCSTTPTPRGGGRAHAPVAHRDG
jgi:carboxylesterase 2